MKRLRLYHVTVRILRMWSRAFRQRGQSASIVSISCCFDGIGTGEGFCSC